MNITDMIEISAETFCETIDVKEYCNEQKNCHNCKIKEECKNFANDHDGCDYSIMELGRVKDGDEFRYFVMCPE